MTTIGFLACEATLPDADNRQTQRRGDAFEHDLMIAALEPAFAASGMALRVIGWEAPLEDFAGIDLVMLGTAWDYQDKAEAFLAKLEALEARGITVCNGADVVRWNIKKTYLRELNERGAATIPTIWMDDVTAADALSAMDRFGCDKVVVKRQIGAGAMGQQLLSRDELLQIDPATGANSEWRFGHPAMVQPFLPAIAEEGELSFIFIGGEASHVVRKRPAKGDYRIQSLYGGLENTHRPTPEETAAARAIIAALPFEPPLYARIDMLRGDGADASKTLMLMEAEMIEPYLYPEQGPHLGEYLARAIIKKVSSI